MDIPTEIRAIETAAKQRGLNIQSILDEAGIDRSTWTRWKSGVTKPRLENWMAVKVAVESGEQAA